jgi:gliding motility-associated-like protein
VQRTAVSVAVNTCNGTGTLNQPPIVTDISKTILQNQSVPFVIGDFTSKFSDSDNDNLFKIRIESLPLHGRLELAGAGVSIGQEIPATDLGKLVFIPVKDYAGDTYFRWSGSDGKVYSDIPASVNITIEALTVFIPEGFSPNGDGINDYFVIKGAERFVVTLRVFNRWGNKVFESEHYKNDWDGAANVGMLITNQLPGGTYYYTVNFNNGEKEIIGYLTLNR